MAQISDGSTAAVASVRLYVENIGAGPAYDLKFTTDLSFSLGEAFSLGKNRSLEIVPFLRHGIGYLTPGQTRMYDLSNETMLGFEELMQKQLEIVVTYKDSMGKKYESCFCLNFREHARS